MSTEIKIPQDLSIPDVRYIAASWGSDTQGNGSYTKPYQTLAKALIGSTGTTTILVFGGVYGEAAVVLPDDITISAFADATVEFTNGFTYTAGATNTNIIIVGININNFDFDATASISGTLVLRQCVFGLNRLDSNYNVLVTSVESTIIASNINGGANIFTEALVIDGITAGPGSIVNFENSRIITRVTAIGTAVVKMLDCTLFVATEFIRGLIDSGNTPVWQVDTTTDFSGGYIGDIDKVLLANVYTTIQEEGVDLIQRRTIDFQGAGVTASDDAINGKTVVNIPGGMGTVTYYLNESVTQAPYKEFTSALTASPEQTIVTSVASGATVTIQSFQTPSGVPGTTNIPGGRWAFYLHFSGTTGDSWDVFAEVYKRDLGGIETLLLTTDAVPTSTLTGTATMILTDGVFPASTVLTTDRIVVKVRVTNTDSTTNSITFHTEGNTNYSIATTTLNQVIPTGAVTSVTGTAPIASSGGTTPAISISQSGAASDGYLSSTDWNTFNSKVPSTRNVTINGTTQDLSADRTWSVGTVTSAGITAGTGISLAGTNPITSSGTITVTNSAPDQTVVLNAGTGIGVTGTYPNFTISNTDPTTGVTLASAGGTETLVNDGTGPSLATKGITAGTGISLSSTATALTVTNSAPDQTVVLTPSTGINVTGTYPNFTIANSAPDQTVALTAGTGIAITGTYPNFTIDNTGATSDTNIYNTDGTLTGNRTATFTGNRLLFTGVNGITTINLDLKATTGSGNRYGKLSAVVGTVTNQIIISAGSVGIVGTDSATLETSTVAADPTQASLSYTNGVISRGIVANSSGLQVNSAFYLPTTDGTANQVMRTNGSGVVSFQSLPAEVQAAASDETTNLTTGTAKVTFRMPYAMTLTAVRASLTTAQTAGALLTVDINLNGVSVLGTKLTFDNNERTTVTAATPATIVTSALTDDGEITVDIDAVGTAGARGLKITLIGTRA